MAQASVLQAQAQAQAQVQAQAQAQAELQAQAQAAQAQAQAQAVAAQVQAQSQGQAQIQVQQGGQIHSIPVSQFQPNSLAGQYQSYFSLASPNQGTAPTIPIHVPTTSPISGVTATSLQGNTAAVPHSQSAMSLKRLLDTNQIVQMAVSKPKQTTAVKTEGKFKNLSLSHIASRQCTI